MVAFFHLDSIWCLDPSLVTQSPEMDLMASNVSSGLYLGAPPGRCNRFLENQHSSEKDKDQVQGSLHFCPHIPHPFLLKFSHNQDS